MAKHGAPVLQLQSWDVQEASQGSQTWSGAATQERRPILPFLQEVLDSFVEIPPRRRRVAKQGDRPGTSRRSRRIA